MLLYSILLFTELSSSDGLSSGNSQQINYGFPVILFWYQGISTPLAGKIPGSFSLLTTVRAL